jgi:hypothetical protein
MAYWGWKLFWQYIIVCTNGWQGIAKLFGEVNNSLPVINMKYGSDIRGLQTHHLVIFKSLSQSLILNVKKKKKKYFPTYLPYFIKQVTLNCKTQFFLGLMDI